MEGLGGILRMVGACNCGELLGLSGAGRGEAIDGYCVCGLYGDKGSEERLIWKAMGLRAVGERGGGWATGERA